MAESVSLEGLEFEISAATSDAIKSLDSLSQSLKNLKSAVDTSINSSIESFKKLNAAISAVSENNPIHKLAESLEKISGISKLSNIKIPDNLGKSISESFSGFEPENLKEISDAVKEFDKSVTGDSFKQLTKITQNLSKIGSNPAKGLPDTIRELSETIDNIPEGLSEKVNQAFSGFELDGLKKVTSSIKAFNKAIAVSADSKIGSAINDIKAALSDMGDKPETLGKLVSKVRALSKVGAIDSSLATELKRISEAINSTNKVDTFKIQNLSSLLANMKQNPSVSWLTDYIKNLTQALNDYPVETSNAVVTELKKFEFQSNFETIKDLASNINTLSTYVTTLNTSLATASTGGLQVFENSAAGISKLNSAISTLDENALNAKITSVDKVFQREFSQNLANSVAGFPDIKLSSIADALSKMKGNDLYLSETFVNNLSLLSDVMKNEWAESDIMKLYSIAEAFPSFKGISEISIPKGFTTFIENLGKKLENLDTTNLPALTSIGQALQGFKGLEDVKLSSSFANQIAKISDSLKNLTEDDINKLHKLADAVKKIGEVGDKSLKLKVNTSDVSKAKNNFDTLKQSIIGTSPVAKIATFTFKNMFLAPLKYAKNLSVAIGKSILSPIQKVASRLKTVIAGFGKIIKLRAFRFIITSITGGIKEGTDNLYQFSKGINGEFAKSMDTLATSMLYFKNSVGAAIAPIINQLAPAVDLLVDKIVDGTNKINQFLAQMTGASYWTKAVKYPKEYAEAVDDAKKSVQDFTMGFDELNIISDNSSNKSADALDYSKMFEIVDLQKNPWTEQLKNAIENGDWYGAGNLLGEKFNSIFQNIDYSGIGSELGTKINDAISLAKGFLDVSDFESIGTGIASFLNSGFEKIDFYNLGSVLAGKWNVIIKTVNGFVKKFKFAKFGKNLSNAVNGWFDTIDLNTAVEDISLGLQGILDTTDAFLTNTKFKEFGNKVGEALNKFVDDLPTIVSKFASTAGDFAIDVFDFLSGTIEGIDWKDSGEKLFDAIENLFTDVDWAGVSSSFAEFLGSAIGASVSLFTGFVGEAQEAYDNLFEWLSSGNVDAGAKFTQWGEDNVVKPLIKGVVTGMYDDDTWNDFESVIEEKGGMFGFFEGWGGYIYDQFHEAGDGAEEFRDTATASLSDTKKGTNEFKENWISGWNTIKSVFKGFVESMEENGYVIYDNIETLKNDFKTFKENWISGWNTIKGKVSDAKTDIRDKLAELGIFIVDFKDNWSTGAEELKKNLSQKWSSIKSDVSENLEPLFDTAKSNFDAFKSNWTDGAETIKNSLSEKWNSIKEKVTDTVNPMFDTANNNFNSFKENWITGFTDIKDKVSEKATAIKESLDKLLNDPFGSLKYGANNILWLFENMVNGVISAMNNMAFTMNSMSFSIPDWVPGIGGGTLGFNLPYISEIQLFRFDKGGFPNSGDLFFANENGRPEFVGSMGGRTAVANNDQIVEGIYSAVYSAMMEVMSSQNGSGTPEFNFYLDSKEISAKVEERRLTRGQQIFTGGVANEY